MNTLALLVLALSASAEQHALKPTSGSGAGFAVTTDQPAISHLGRVVTLPAGATLSVASEDRRETHVTLIGPTGVESWEENGGRWSSRLETPGGYKLQYGRDKGRRLPAQLDFVVTSQASAVQAPGMDAADALYEVREFSEGQVPTVIDQP